jgi:hypothetical protein
MQAHSYMCGVARCVPGRRGTVRLNLYPPTRHSMNSIIYIVGLVVIIGFILGYFGLR